MAIYTVYLNDRHPEGQAKFVYFATDIDRLDDLIDTLRVGEAVIGERVEARYDASSGRMIERGRQQYALVGLGLVTAIQPHALPFERA